MRLFQALLGMLLIGGMQFSVQAQEDTDGIRTTNFPEMRTLVNAPIPGAPVLSQPQRIDGSLQEIRTEKHGLVYPAFYDWNHDGKKDLLLGEFETGKTGSYIKVYLNEGTDEMPRFSGKYEYAQDVNGDTITNFQWCCIGIHPRIVDLDGDGYLDILSGQYEPGQISWWRGSEKGFLPRQFIDQEGYKGSHYPGRSIEGDNPENASYWYYTSAHFADFNGDGLLDLFVGGGDMRVALNVGTKEHPKFGIRHYLLHTDGTKLEIANRQAKDVRAFKTYLNPVDWDGDGVLDLLVSYEYTDDGHCPIEFFKGVKTADGLRFEKSVPLFSEAEGRKELPGCQPMITVTDYNNDGVNDIVFGLSIPTVNGFEVAPEVAWDWVHNLGINTPGKDAGRATVYYGGLEGFRKKVEEDSGNKNFYLGKLDDYKYLTLRHRGYVFVMYGAKNDTPAQAAASVDIQSGQASVALEQEASANDGFNDELVACTLEVPEKVKPGKTAEAVVTLNFKDGWHGYANEGVNIALGFIPTTVTLEFTEAARKVGDMVMPKTSLSGPYPVYEGKGVTFRQSFVCPKTTGKSKHPVKVRAKVSYQVCDESMCASPEELTLEKEIQVK